MRTKRSEEENEVYKLVIEGLTNKQIALRLGVTLGVVRHHVSHILGAMRAKNRYQLISQSKGRK